MSRPQPLSLAEAEAAAERKERGQSLSEQASEWSGSLRLFVRHSWSDGLGIASPFVPGWHIDAICEHLQAVTLGELRRLVICVPPGSTKSSITSICWPAWEWTRDPKRRHLTASYDQRLATRFSVASRTLMTTAWFTSRWGGRFSFRTDENLKTEYANNWGGRRLAISTTTGTGEHGDVIIIDDPHNASEILSDSHREACIEWHDGTMSTRFIDAQKGAEVIIAQRLHECLPPDALVRTPDGSRPINQLAAGDEVLTSAGVEQVAAVASRHHHGELIEIRCYGSCIKFRATGNHRVLTTEGWVRSDEIAVGQTLVLRGPNPARRGVPEWPAHTDRLRIRSARGTFTGARGRVPSRERVEALVAEGLTIAEMAPRLGYSTRGSVQNALLHHGIDRPASRVVDASILDDLDFWWFVGLWLAEGCVTLARGKRSHVRLTLHVGERDLLERAEQMLARHGLTITSKITGNVVQASIFSIQLGIFLRQFGRSAKSKHLPAWVAALPRDTLRMMFSGYWQGDGCHSKNPSGTDLARVASASLDLLEGWQHALVGIGVPSSIMTASRAHEICVDGIHVYLASDSYELRLYLIDVPWLIPCHAAKAPGKIRHVTVEKGDLHLVVRSIDRAPYDGEVWDIETPCHDFLTHSVTAHNSDLIGHVLKNDPNEWTVLCLPERYEPKHPFVTPAQVKLPSGRYIAGDPREVEGELLSPGRVNAESNARRAKVLGAFRAAGQLQQRPSAREGTILKRLHWRFYPEAWLHDGERHRLPPFHGLCQSWDTAFKDRTVNDFVAGGLWGLIGADMYLLAMRVERMSLSQTKRAVREMNDWALKEWPLLPMHVLIERSANGPEVINELRSEIRGLVPWPADGSKIQRAEAAEPTLEGGNVYVPGASDPDLPSFYDPARTPAFAQSLVEECSAFPFGEHDDQVDQFTQAVNWSRTAGRQTKVTISRPRGNMPQQGSLAGLRA